MNATEARRWAEAGTLAMMLLAACTREGEGGGRALAGGATTGPAARERAEAVAVYFSPATDLQALLIERIGAAKRSVHVQAYSLSSAPIAEALLAAQRRGVEVRVVLDAERAGAEGSESKRLARGGVATFADSKESKAHSKIMLIDGETIVTGSYNFAEVQQKETADNLVLIESKEKLMEAYEGNFMLHLKHSKRIKAK